MYLVLEEPLPVFGSEAVFVDGEPVGQTTSGNYGYTIGQSLVLGYVPAELAAADTFEVECFGKRTRASRLSRAAYNPTRRRILQ